MLHFVAHLGLPHRPRDSLFEENVFCLCRLPTTQFLIRNPSLFLIFWQEFLRLPRINTYTLTAYRTKTNSQREQISWFLEQHLHCFLNYHRLSFTENSPTTVPRMSPPNCPPCFAKPRLHLRFPPRSSPSPQCLLFLTLLFASIRCTKSLNAGQKKLRQPSNYMPVRAVSQPPASQCGMRSGFCPEP